MDVVGGVVEEEEVRLLVEWDGEVERVRLRRRKDRGKFLVMRRGEIEGG